MTSTLALSHPDVELEESALLVPASIPPEVLKLLQQTFNAGHVEKGMAWVLDHMKDDQTPLQLMSEFARRLEEQMMHLCGATLENHLPVFRTGLYQKCLATLPFFRVRFADKGYNPLFLQTWLQKQIVASMFGLTQRDIELKIRVSGRTAPRYLEEQMRHFVPKTCLKQLYT
ncbi:TPA: hypothetical protein DDW35_04640 [Candidatus Sumerlaeota bacterium]|jgi:hypothetical protein|nr:hypothetical protein [Candidatus Sumerlaeota bacterium]